jgi:hypothetical protein
MARMDSGGWSPQRSYQMPVLHLAVAQVIDALAQRFGASVKHRVRYAPDPFIDRVFARFPPLLTPRALELGLRHDHDAQTLVANALGL